MDMSVESNFPGRGNRVFRDMLQKARAVLKGYCNVCPVCDGTHCVGKLPGMGGAGDGESFRVNVSALRAIKLNHKYIHAVKIPDIKISFLGHSFEMPVFAAPLTGVLENMGGFTDECSFSHCIVKGCMDAGSFAFTGDGDTKDKFLGGIQAISRLGAKCAVILKPRSQDLLKKKICIAEENGAVAVGIDIDSIGLINMLRKGEEMEPKTSAHIEELVQHTELPFILKGVMSVEDAHIAAQTGVSAVVVSNHGGRISPYHPPVAWVLPGIAESLPKSMTVIADGGVRTGGDVFKYIALGADAVLVGRPLVSAVAGEGNRGVRMLLEICAGELSTAMVLTGCNALSEIDKDSIFIKT